MMDISNNINSILLDSLNLTTSEQTTKSSGINAVNKKISDIFVTNPVKISVNDVADISKSAVDNFKYDLEGNVISGLDLIEATGDALDEMANNLDYLRSVLADADSYGDKFGLYEWLEEQANAILDCVLDIYNNTEYNGVKIFSGLEAYTSTAMLDNYQNFVFSLGSQGDIYSQLIINTQIDVEALHEMRGLSIYDDDYEVKLDEIMSDITAKREELEEKKQILDNSAQSIYEENDAVYESVHTVSMEDILQQIINNADGTLKSVTGDLKSDVLLQFLNNR